MPSPAGPHLPGSFTKNFAWHGKGLLKLHEGIRRGFSSNLQPVTRQAFRSACGLDDAGFLLAANFFLFNTPVGPNNIIPVDELVRQAVQEPHSSAFDRLGLFVLNLSLGGRRVGNNVGNEYPTQWANEFVRQSLWQAGRWQRGALEESGMDSFLASRIRAGAPAKRKMRSNYRHIFELVRYLPNPPGPIDSDPQSWAAGALFTAWDRRGLTASSPRQTAASLIAASIAEEDYKLLGITVEEFRELAEPIAGQYELARGLQRLQPTVHRTGGATTAVATASGATGPTISAPRAIAPLSAPTSAAAADLSWLTTASATDAAVARQIEQRLAQKRNQLLAMRLKAHYGHTCMACGSRLAVGLDPERFYSEAAHIKPLGKPHDGPDSPDNMIVLCPNHHLQFDRGIVSLEATRGGFRFVSHIPKDPIHHRALTLEPGHALDASCVTWHASLFRSKTT
ncbi:HNH endonuclease [Roseomonas rosulenta]|uniref:HNH endonuclease n=1 Tax=Roseomonas rosulenta TaxID=2748667 RepID=UPI0018DFF45E|nr:HNH endonuclease [Roseomonas rosulenta]